MAAIHRALVAPWASRSSSVLQLILHRYQESVGQHSFSPKEAQEILETQLHARTLCLKSLAQGRKALGLFLHQLEHSWNAQHRDLLWRPLVQWLAVEVETAWAKLEGPPCSLRCCFRLAPS
jgi:hypothetical protein